jgi:hypothetical protein
MVVVAGWTTLAAAGFASAGEPDDPEEQARDLRRARERAQAELQRAHRLEVRYQARLLPRVTVAAGVASGAFGFHLNRWGSERYLSFTAVTFNAGYWRYLNRYWAWHAGLELLDGGLTDGAGLYNPLAPLSGDPHTSMTDFSATGGLFVQPGRAYLGVHASLGYRSFADDRLALYDGPFELGPYAGLHPSLAAQAGVLLLRREQLDLNGRLQVDLSHGGLQVFVSVGYHFFVDP